jgi:hypothetical protein
MLDRLSAPDADFHLVRLEALDDAAATRLDAGARRSTSALQYFVRSAICACAAFDSDNSAIADVAAMASSRTDMAFPSILDLSRTVGRSGRRGQFRGLKPGCLSAGRCRG